MKNMNQYASSRISNKMNKIEDIVSSQVKKPTHLASTIMR